jgi:hypothetical protein
MSVLLASTDVYCIPFSARRSSASMHSPGPLSIEIITLNQETMDAIDAAYLHPMHRLHLDSMLRLG